MHRNGWFQPHHGANGPPGAQDGRSQGHARRDDHQPGCGAVGQLVEAEYFVVHVQNHQAYPAAKQQTADQSQARDGHGQPQVMPDDGPVVIAQGLECSNLTALCGHLAADHHVQDEHRHSQKNRGQHRPHDLQLRQFVAHNPCRNLLVQAHGAPRAVVRQNAVGLVYHGLQPRGVVQAQRGLVEGALHVKGLRHAFVVDPPNAKCPVVGCTTARGKNIFG